MTHNIISFPSGFYGIQVISTGEIIKADLVKWDGKRGSSTPYRYINDTQFEMYQDANNTVYYSDPGGVNCRVWCSGKNLSAHLHHLDQVLSRA